MSPENTGRKNWNMADISVSNIEEDDRLVIAEARKRARADDEQLIDEFLEGSEQAFNRLVLKHQKMAFNIALRYLGSYEEAEEVAQDAFVKVYRSLPKFRGKSLFTTWLYRIVMNTARNYLRKRARRGDMKNLSLDDPIQFDDGQAVREIADQRASPENKFRLSEMSDMIDRSLAALRPEMREVVILRDVEGLRYDQIARVLKLNVGTVKSRLHRARVELRAMLRHLL